MKAFLVAITVLLSGAVSAFCQQGNWSTNYAKAVEQAKAENKPILLDFTGSDWCGWCMKMKKESLDTPQFTAYAQKNLVLVTLDFPHSTPLPPAVKQQNDQLNTRYRAEGFPTFVLVDKTGRELGRQTGYLPGGATAFIAMLNKFYVPAPKAAGTPADDFDTFFKKLPVGSPIAGFILAWVGHGKRFGRLAGTVNLPCEPGILRKSWKCSWRR